MTLNKIGNPVTTCQAKSDVPATLAAICNVLAVSLPFCIAGIQAMAAAHNTTKPVQHVSILALYIIR
jgi:hypothetical protein